MCSPFLGEDIRRAVQLRRRILIVGDSSGLCKSLARALCHPELSLRTAETREGGLEILTRESVDFVIAEHHLPPSSGIDFLETVKQLFPQTTRILITGECDVAVIRDAIKRSGVSFFLGKPWDAHSLQELLSGLLLVDRPTRRASWDIAADFEAEIAAHSIRNGGSTTSSPRNPRCSMAQVRTHAIARIAKCETEGELVSILGEEFGCFVPIRELGWWNDSIRALFRIGQGGAGFVTLSEAEMTSQLIHVLDSIDALSHPFVLDSSRMFNPDCGIEQKLLVLPIVAEGQVMATFLLVADAAEHLTGWPLDLAESLNHALGPTLLRLRRDSRNRTCPCEINQRSAGSSSRPLVSADRARSKNELNVQADRGGSDATRFIRTKTMQRKNLAEELLEADSNGSGDVTRRE